MSNRSFVRQQNRFRGLVSAFRSTKFVQDRITSPTQLLRTGIHNLLLEARVELHPSQFDRYLQWVNHQYESQLADFSALEIGYEELSGVYPHAKKASLGREIQWICSRIKANADALARFRSRALIVEELVFLGDYGGAIDELGAIEHAFGGSIWSVQLRIALEHLAGGLERQKRYAADVRTAHKRGLLSFLTFHTSVRNEDKTTLAKYRDDVAARVAKHRYYSPPVKTYVLYHLSGEWPRSEREIADVLLVEQSHSLIDVYETFIALAKEMVRHEQFSDIRSLLRTQLRKLEGLSDFRVTKISFALSETGTTLHTLPRNLAVSDALFSGSAKKAALQARRILKTAEGVDPWQHIYAGFAFAHTARRKMLDRSHPKAAYQFISHFYDGRDENGNYDQLLKLCTNLNGLPTAVGIQEMLRQLKKASPDDPWQPWLIGLSSKFLGPEDVLPKLAGLNLEKARQGPTPPTEEAWRRFSHQGAAAFSQKGPNFELLTAARHLRNSEFLEAIRALDVNGRAQEAEPLNLLTASILLHAHYALSNRTQIIELIGDEGARNATSHNLLPVVSTLGHYEWPDYRPTAPLSLAVPIALHLVWSKTEDDSSASLLRFATRRALKASGVEHPSKLFDNAEKYPEHQLIYFLRFVCIPQVLDATRFFKSSLAVMEERQAICAALRSLDPANAREYEEEVSAISNQLALDEGQWIVDRTRIHVDVGGLERWATRELAEDVARCRDLLTVDIEEKQDFDEVMKELITSTPSQSLLFKPDDEADAVLIGILSRLREEFLNNPSFGLDFYLSQRIRHQSFVGLIRGPLEFRQLITTKEADTGNYRPNDFWLDKFQGVDDEGKQAISSALVRFARKFDGVLLTAKDSRFQIQSADHPKGLIYLDLSSQSLALARLLFRMDPSLSDFIATAVALLWGLLEGSLARARQYIKEDLNTKVAETFDELRAAVRKRAGDDPAMLEFDLEVGGCSTEVQRALEDSAKWFSHANTESLKRFFRLDQVVSIAIDSALKCQRSFEPIISKEVAEGDLRMAASTLVFVNDVLFVALDNVHAHSGLRSPHIAVSVAPNLKGGTLQIEVISDSKAQIREREALESRLGEIRKLIDAGQAPSKTRQEGGSGLLKLAAVVSQSPKGKLEFGFLDSRRFRMAVVYSLVIQKTEIAGEQVEQCECFTG